MVPGASTEEEQFTEGPGDLFTIEGPNVDDVVSGRAPLAPPPANEILFNVDALEDLPTYDIPVHRQSLGARLLAALSRLMAQL